MGVFFWIPEPRVHFSDCGRYRYTLEWPTGRNNDEALLFVGANPSKAGSLDAKGEVRSDPTVSRMRSQAYDLGYGWLWVVNVRSWVSTDPNGVPPDPDGIGPLTDKCIMHGARKAALVICGWGHLAGSRGPVVLDMIRSVGAKPYALALTQDGTPRHPRGVPKSARLWAL